MVWPAIFVSSTLERMQASAASCKRLNIRGSLQAADMKLSQNPVRGIMTGVFKHLPVAEEQDMTELKPVRNEFIGKTAAETQAAAAIPTGSSIVSSPGCSSIAASWRNSRIPVIPCSNGCASCRSPRPISTSSSWCGWPGWLARSARASRSRARTGARRSNSWNSCSSKSSGSRKTSRKASSLLAGLLKKEGIENIRADALARE